MNGKAWRDSTSRISDLDFKRPRLRSVRVCKSCADVSIVVDEQGSATQIFVLRPLGGRLDEAAISSVAHWKFKPGTKDGKAGEYSRASRGHVSPREPVL
jgi:TonB family protein